MAAILHCDSLIRETAAKAAASWFAQQAANRFAVLYAYFRRPSGEESIAPMLVTDETPEGDGWEMVFHERLNPSWSKEECAGRIAMAAERLPMLNPGLDYCFDRG